MSGELSILNVAAGDIKVTIDKDNPADIEKAKGMIADMLKRGYTIAVEVDGKLEPIQKFDAEKSEYVIVEAIPAGDETTPDAKRPKGEKRGGYRKRSVPMGSTKATAIPRTGGG